MAGELDRAGEAGREVVLVELAGRVDPLEDAVSGLIGTVSSDDLAARDRAADVADEVVAHAPIEVSFGDIAGNSVVVVTVILAFVVSCE